MKREYNVCLYLSLFPPVLFPLHLRWLNRLKLNWCHCTAPQVKGSAELSHSLEGHQKTPRCHLSSGWAGTWVHTLPKEDTLAVLTLSALTPFCRLKKCGTFTAFFWKRAFQGNIEQTNSFHRDCSCELFLQRPGKERTDSFCLSLPHPWKKAGPNLLVGILVHSLPTLRSN